MVFTGILKAITACASTLFIAAAITCTYVPTAPMPSNNMRLHRIANVPTGTGRHNLYFATELQGWFAIGQVLWESSDGGKNWQAIWSGEGHWLALDEIRQIEFADREKGWMLADRVYGTRDGGRTWAGLSLPTCIPHSIELLKDGEEGWVAGEKYRPISKGMAEKFPSQLLSPDGSRGIYPVLFHTYDGGKTWTELTLPSPEGRVLHFFLLDSQHYWASSDTAVFYSQEGQWKKTDYSQGQCVKQLLLDTVNPRNIIYAPSAIYFLSHSQGWLGFQNGYVARSIDGGRTWCDLSNPRDIFPDPTWETYFTKIHFRDVMHGFALAANGLLYATDDGGSDWETLDSNLRFYDVYFFADGHGLGVTQDGLYHFL